MNYNSAAALAEFASEPVVIASTAFKGEPVWSPLRTLLLLSFFFFATTTTILFRNSRGPRRASSLRSSDVAKFDRKNESSSSLEVAVTRAGFAESLVE